MIYLGANKCSQPPCQQFGQLTTKNHVIGGLLGLVGYKT